MLRPNLIGRGSKTGISLRVNLHLCLDIVPCHVEESEVGAKRGCLKGQDIGLVLLLQTSQPIQVRFEPLGRSLRRLIHRIVQEALPLKECQVPGEVPNPKPTSTSPGPEESVTSSLSGDFKGVPIGCDLLKTHVHPEAFAPSGHGHLPSRGQRHGQRQATVTAQRPELLVERHGQRHLHAPMNGLIQQSDRRAPKLEKPQWCPASRW
mmetsp:Transcript_59057/g.129492  ORF Transcript_59057/g.129492 Transcript_59057/m.129492 type:complete len:207 (+) Transcript_59057:150-770(+)